MAPQGPRRATGLGNGTASIDAAGNNDHFRHRVGGTLLAILGLAFALGRQVTNAEIDRYLAIIERRLLPAEEVKAFTSRLRSWAEADDGRPVYMFNLIHFLPQFRTFPGAPEFKGTLQEANAYYEKSIMWLWLRHAAYPIFSGVLQARNLINMESE